MRKIKRRGRTGQQDSKTATEPSSYSISSELATKERKKVAENLISRSETWQIYTSVGLSKAVLLVILLVAGLQQGCKRNSLGQTK